MCRVQKVLLTVVALYVGVVHSWDIAISVKEQLIFYTNGTKISSINLISQNPTSLVYDEVHNMMLYVDKQDYNDAVCGYDLSSKDNKCFIKRNRRNIKGLAFDPVTEIIFFTDVKERSINWFSLKPGCNNNVYGNLLIQTGSQTPGDVAVDSCEGYVYWTYSDMNIERARFNGSERKVKYGNSSWKQFSIVIDSQTQKMFYFDICRSCSNSHGYLSSQKLNETTESNLLDNFYGPECQAKKLTISKDYIYWKNDTGSYNSIWQLPKTAAQYVEPKQISKIDDIILGITANYKIKDQVHGIQDCDSLSSLIPKLAVSSGSTGEQSHVSACDNYCVYGNCYISGEGSPKCRCNAGYSGQRCEINICYNYCLNDGECFLNEEEEPICTCVGNHVGARCEAEANISDTTPPTYDLTKKNLTLADILSTWRKPSSKMYLTVEV